MDSTGFEKGDRVEVLDFRGEWEPAVVLERYVMFFVSGPQLLFYCVDTTGNGVGTYRKPPEVRAEPG